MIMSEVPLPSQDITSIENVSPEHGRFDQVVGILEELLVDEEFVKLQNDYCERYCHEFIEDEENKLCYMEIFQNYNTLIEQYIESHIKQTFPWFNLKEFQEMLKQEEVLEGEVFEVLESMGDFQEFKDMMLDYKKKANLDGLLVMKSA